MSSTELDEADQVEEPPEDAAFRGEARHWLTEHAPAFEQLPVSATPPTTLAEYHRRQDISVAHARRWQAALAAAGWAGVSWPIELGGRGGTPRQGRIFAEEQARHPVSNGPLLVALAMVAPTLLAHGSSGQQARHVPAILRGDEIWCQLYSEPGAGSDLASLRTQATPHGDGWIVQGQKVWTSLATHADWAILLARTNPDRPKHHGITYFVLDMKSPGVEVRPLREMSGTYHFNEVFLTDVELPGDSVVGVVDEGWRVAHTTMAAERAMIGSGQGSNIADLLTLARRRGRDGDPVVRQALAEVVIADQILKFLSLRARADAARGAVPGPGASVMKLLFSMKAARASAAALAIEGMAGSLAGPSAPEDGRWQHAFLSAPGLRIGGGTDEVQRNSLSERVLGLPREPAPDRGRPFRELDR